MQTYITLDKAFVETDATVETTALAEIVKDVFLLSMDLRVPSELQGLLHAIGTKLRTQLRELLNKVFDAGTAELLAANETITEVNARLKQAKADIDRVANTVEGLGKLAKQLDDLLKIAGVFL